MKKYFIIALVLLTTTAAFAQKKRSKRSKEQPATSTQQDTTVVNKTLLAPVAPATSPISKVKRDWSKANLTKRSADHFMFQLGYDNWAGAPDSINIRGFNRSANFYFMFDFPFKTDPRLSIGAGLGIGSSNIFFHQQKVLVAAQGAGTLGFPSEANGDHWKKYKLVTTYLEAPVELRFALDPEHMDKSWKFAVGVKVGLMLSAYTKAKDRVNNVGQTIGNYIEKESSKQFFNSPKLAGTARISKGVIGLFGQFQANSLIKTSAGPSVFPFSMGIVLSGL
ncbi:MAG: outer membrane beta-barrel protein [Bacteroidetes bacterium]|nr:outer membrane beta-barrel protein [Bacteroidota bacterium]